MFFCLNGALFVDRKSKVSKHEAKERIKKLLLRGENIFLFPEGTWNYTPNELLLPLNWGCIEIAQFCNVPIIPFVMDYHDNRCKIKWGEKLSIPKTMDKKMGIELLEEKMATLLWELFEDETICHREDVSGDWWDQEWERRVLAYPKLDAEYERTVARQVRY